MPDKEPRQCVLWDQLAEDKTSSMHFSIEEASVPSFEDMRRRLIHLHAAQKRLAEQRALCNEMRRHAIAVPRRHMDFMDTVLSIARREHND